MSGQLRVAAASLMKISNDRRWMNSGPLADLAEIAKRAYAENRPVLEAAEEMTDLSREELEKLLDPGRLTPGR